MLSRLASTVAAAAGTVVTSLATARARHARAASPAPAPESGAQPWTAARLKLLLGDRLAGQRIIVVANREPVIHEWNGDGIVARHPASGLVTALEPVIRACSGAWVAHGSGSADRDVADRDGRVLVSDESGSYQLRRVWLTPEEERGYYYGFANEALWPLCHLAHGQPVFRRGDWEHYRRVNQRFADTVADEADSDTPIVLVQDYHFALVPLFVRKRFPRATILTFWHIPWPNAERFSICPYEMELLHGLLGSSILGFQTPLHCHNFIESVDRGIEARIARDDMTVVRDRRSTIVRSYPISVEWPARGIGSSPGVAECRERVRADLGIPSGAALVVSVDRLDYTKGFEERLLSFERILEQVVPESVAFVQVAAPSRDLIDRYREFGDRVRALVDRINARFASPGYTPILFVNRHCPADEIRRYYRAADVCYVSSLHDGMNLVAKEFVAARDDEHGVLVLSRFAGAARELTEALLVNPYDVDGVADTLFTGLAMTGGEQRERMRAMRAVVAAHNVYAWAGAMLMDATMSREREHLRDRLSLRRRPAAAAVL